MHSAAAHVALVERLQTQASTHPVRYRFKVLLLAGFGYAVLLCALLLALALSAGVATALLLTKSVWAIKLIKLAWIPLLLAWLILRALWVRVAAPQGRVLAADEAPALQAEVERLRLAAGAPRLTGIVIDTEFNAAAQSVPRLLGLAGNRHYLVLGLPLMRALAPAELSAVIAHEFGHFNGGHGRFAGRIYRVRASWFRLLESLQQQSTSASTLFVRFFNWYARYFNAYSFVLARENEYEADAVSARVAGVDAARGALVRCETSARRLQESFWPSLQRRNLTQAEPPASLFADMARALGGEDDADAIALADALERRPDFDDTHPTLAQRLGALGLAAAVPAAHDRDAAKHWMGEFADQLQAEFDAQWLHAADAAWRHRHDEFVQARGRLVELRTKRHAQALDDTEHLEFALLVDDLDAPESGEDLLALFREAVERNPGHALTHFRLGALLLATEPANGIVHIERAGALDPQATPSVLQLLAQHHHARGDGDALTTVLDRMRVWDEQQSRAAIARQAVGRKDAFLPHGLEDETLAAVRCQLHAHGKVAKSWLVRKRIDDGGGVPHFVVLVEWRGLMFSESSQLQRLVDLLELPGSMIAIGAGGHGGVAKRIRKVAGEPVYRRGWFA